MPALVGFPKWHVISGTLLTFSWPGTLRRESVSVFYNFLRSGLAQYRRNANLAPAAETIGSFSSLPPNGPFWLKEALLDSFSYASVQRGRGGLLRLMLSMQQNHCPISRFKGRALENVHPFLLDWSRSFKTSFSDPGTLHHPRVTCPLTLAHHHCRLSVYLNAQQKPTKIATLDQKNVTLTSEVSTLSSKAKLWHL